MHVRRGAVVAHGEVCEVRHGGVVQVDGSTGSEVWGPWILSDGGILDAKVRMLCQVGFGVWRITFRVQRSAFSVQG